MALRQIQFSLSVGSTAIGPYEIYANSVSLSNLLENNLSLSTLQAGYSLFVDDQVNDFIVYNTTCGKGYTVSVPAVSPSPTPSVTVTRTPSVTPSVTITITPTPTSTVTPSITPSMTPSTSYNPTILQSFPCGNGEYSPLRSQLDSSGNLYVSTLLNAQYSGSDSKGPIKINFDGTLNTDFEERGGGDDTYNLTIGIALDEQYDYLYVATATAFSGSAVGGLCRVDTTYGRLDTTWGPVTGNFGNGFQNASGNQLNPHNITLLASDNDYAYEPPNIICYGGGFNRYNYKTFNSDICIISSSGDVYADFNPSVQSWVAIGTAPFYQAQNGAGGIKRIKRFSNGKVMAMGNIATWEGANICGALTLDLTGSVLTSFGRSGSNAEMSLMGRTGLSFPNDYAWWYHYPYDAYEDPTTLKVTIGGDFYYASGSVQPSIARFLGDGKLDTTFNSPFTYDGTGNQQSVRGLVVRQVDKKTIIVGNNFTGSGGAKGIMCLNEDGTEDSGSYNFGTGFSQPVSGEGTVDVYEYGSTGIIYVLGDIGTFNGGSSCGIAKITPAIAIAPSATPTPTLTPTLTRTPTVTPTKTITPTPSITSSPPLGTVYSSTGLAYSTIGYEALCAAGVSGVYNLYWTDNEIPQVGQILYSDPSLTTPAVDGYYYYIGGQYLVLSTVGQVQQSWTLCPSPTPTSTPTPTKTPTPTPTPSTSGTPTFRYIETSGFANDIYEACGFNPIFDFAVDGGSTITSGIEILDYNNALVGTRTNAFTTVPSGWYKIFDGATSYAVNFTTDGSGNVVLYQVYNCASLPSRTPTPTPTPTSTSTAGWNLTRCSDGQPALQTLAYDPSLNVGETVYASDGNCYTIASYVANTTATLTLVYGIANCSDPICNPPCACPEGYTANDANDGCERITTTGLSTSTTTYTAGNAGTDAGYGSSGLRIYNTGFNSDGSGTLAYTSTTTDLWNERLNNIGVWVFGNIYAGGYYTFCQTINLASSKTYYFGIAGDNQIKLKINGTTIITQPAGTGGYNYPTSNFNFWSIYPITLSSGSNSIEITNYNEYNTKGAFGAEIYDNTLSQLENATSTGDLNIEWSTSFYRTGGSLEGSFFCYAQTCPTGYTLKGADTANPYCELIETTSCQ